MRKQRLVGSFLVVVLGSLGAFAAPQVQPEAKQRTAASQANVAPTAKPKVSARAALTKVKASAAEEQVAKSHKFGLVAGAVAVTDEQQDRPALVVVPKPRVFKKDTTPKLNIAKFGETVHAALKDKVRGYALGLRQNDQHVLTLIWDWSRTPEQGGQGWNLDTRMHVASVSKLMTAIVATKMLHDSGRNFDTKIGEFLPDYWEQPTNSANVTFRQLLTHRAGFTIYDGDFLSFKRQIEQGASPGAGEGYTNGSFSLVRVLVSTATGAVNPNWVFDVNLPVDTDALNDALWDLKTQQAFLNYAQAKVFTPSGVAGVSAEPGSVGAYGYSGKTDKQGWNSGNVAGQLGGAGFRLSVNELLNVMGTFRRKGTIVPANKAKEAIEAMLGLDQAIDTPAGTIYNKNGRWQTGSSPSADTEQSVVYFMPNNIEVAVLVNSWLGPEQASLRGTITNAYTSNLE